MRARFLRGIASISVGLIFAACPLLGGGDPKTCLDLSARQDQDVHSPSGILVTVNGYNRCADDVDGGASRFKVNAIGASGTAIAGQSGRFGGTVAPHGRVETKVFVQCDPDRVRSITVETE